MKCPAKTYGRAASTLWDDARIAEGGALLLRALGRQKVGPFQIKAAIADCQMGENGPDWPQIAALYTVLLRFEPTPVVTLNAAVAVAEAGDAARGLIMVEALATELKYYQPWHAAYAALLATMGRCEAAIQAYDTAIAMAPGEAEVLFLERRRAALRPVEA